MFAEVDFAPIALIFASGFFCGTAGVVGSLAFFLARNTEYNNSVFRVVFYLSLLLAVGCIVGLFLR